MGTLESAAGDSTLQNLSTAGAELSWGQEQEGNKQRNFKQEQGNSRKENQI